MVTGGKVWGHVVDEHSYRTICVGDEEEEGLVEPLPIQVWERD